MSAPRSARHGQRGPCRCHPAAAVAARHRVRRATPRATPGSVVSSCFHSPCSPWNTAGIVCAGRPAPGAVLHVRCGGEEAAASNGGADRSSGGRSRGCDLRGRRAVGRGGGGPPPAAAARDAPQGDGGGSGLRNRRHGPQLEKTSVRQAAPAETPHPTGTGGAGSAGAGVAVVGIILQSLQETSARVQSISSGRSHCG